MNYRITGSKHHKTTNWVGGTTTELYIFPTTAIYEQRNFDFRLSTATVQIEKSVFTPLQGVSRKLMVLDGKMELKHQNHHSTVLNKFDIDEFEGDWKTSSVGKCIDFNLMTMGKTKGFVNAMTVDQAQVVDFPSHDYGWLFVYIHKGKVSFVCNTQFDTLNIGDLLVWKSHQKPSYRSQV